VAGTAGTPPVGSIAIPGTSIRVGRGAAIAGVAGIVVVALLLVALAGGKGDTTTTSAPPPGSSQAPGGTSTSAPSQPSVCDAGTGQLHDLQLLHRSIRIEEGWEAQSDLFFTWSGGGPAPIAQAKVWGFPGQRGDATAVLNEFIETTSDQEPGMRLGQPSSMALPGAVTSSVLLPFDEGLDISGASGQEVGAWAAAVRPEGYLIIQAYAVSPAGEQMADEIAEALGRFIDTAVASFGC
jgi:hypothetical protein